MRYLFSAILVTALVLTGLGYRWVNQPMTAREPVVDILIAPGASARDVADNIALAGVDVNATLLYGWFRFSGKSRQIKAGSYEIEAGTSPLRLLDKLVRGEEALRSVTLVEGWTFRQVRDALRKADHLRADSQALATEKLMEKLGKPGLSPEGLFFPDTYTYSKGSSDVALLQRAMRTMEQKLAAAWAQRSPQISVKSADQALILASIIEKETGSAADRAAIGAVFNNRLRIGMRLQTDPTVIFGMGEAFDGNLRKSDLIRDTPWNTYTREGLPPTPIAMPGMASLMAAVKPATTTALYFVARGDGSSQFSATLDEHNRAVNKYQRGH